jgi:hypothetical protein
MNSAPGNLRQIVKLLRRYLQRKHRRVPKEAVLTALLETAFYASMKCEEARRVICTFAFVNANNPSGQDPVMIRPQRRTYVALKQPIAFNVRNLLKLSQAVPPWASCIAICAKSGALTACGLFDQEIHYRNFLNREDDIHFERPGLFQVEISGVGSLAIQDDRTLIATLSQDALVTKFHDVLQSGPVSKVISRIASQRVSDVRRLLAASHTSSKYWSLREFVSDFLGRTLSRILLSIRRSGHGGAVLILPTDNSSDLNIKYEIDYPKLDRVIIQHIASIIARSNAMDIIQYEFMDEQREELPMGLYLEESVAAADEEDAIKAELGCVSFIASLARVDGCVLLSSGLRVRGFGVEITCRKDPPAIFAAHDELGSKHKRRQLDFSQFGTRHRSMMRYCYLHAGSVGFVISQDGDVRAIMKLGNALVLWENVRLQEIVQVRHRPLRHGISA